VLGQGRLRDVQALRGPGEAAEFRDGEETLDLAKRDVHGGNI
jgi:hypothetical protein